MIAVHKYCATGLARRLTTNRIHMCTDPDALNDQLGIPRGLVAARGLCRHPEAGRLDIADIGEDGREFLLTPSTAVAWRNMKIAAQENGITLYLVSAFRGVARQAEIIQEKLNAGMSIDAILAVCAPPGYSEHHTGRAVDIATPGALELEEAFEDTDAFRWLAVHAATFGFTLSYPRGNSAGYDYEPWHWCFNGDG